MEIRGCRQRSFGASLQVAVHLRAFSAAAAQARLMLKKSKAAYVDELGKIFAGASQAKDVQALFKAIKGLVPAFKSSQGFRCAVRVRDNDPLCQSPGRGGRLV